jgi:hypothetical protein
MIDYAEQSIEQIKFGLFKPIIIANFIWINKNNYLFIESRFALKTLNNIKMKLILQNFHCFSTHIRKVDIMKVSLFNPSNFRLMIKINIYI